MNIKYNSLCLKYYKGGVFMFKEKDLRLQFRGSKNQRIIDVQKSINDNRTVLWNKKG